MGILAKGILAMGETVELRSRIINEIRYTLSCAAFSSSTTTQETGLPPHPPLRSSNILLFINPARRSLGIHSSCSSLAESVGDIVLAPN